MAANKKNKTNFYIDIAMFLVMGALIGIGILIKYVLLPGQERWKLLGENMELTFLGLGRHEWGTIHLILGGALFVLLILHIVFHWKTIKCFFRRYVASLQGRQILTVVTVVLFLFLAVFPVFVTPEKEAIDRGGGRRMIENMDVDLSDSIRVRLKKPKKMDSGDLEMEVERKQAKDPEQAKSEIEVKGSMSLGDVVQEYGIPLSMLKEALNLPEDVSGSERLGRLKKQYDFTMGDVKSVVMEYGE